MAKILGISAFYHDSAAALVVDGGIVAAAQEERFTRKKHDSAFPANAVAYCLREAKLNAADLDYIVFYDKPLLKFDRLFETYLSFAPRGFQSFKKAIPVWLKEKMFLRRELRKHLRGAVNAKYVFPEHHESHAASAFFPSPYAEAAILTMDGVGEWTTTSLGIGRGNKMQLESEIRFPHSLGLLYSAFTYYCGFKVNSGEYKLMGLAPCGTPKYVDQIFNHLIDVKEDGSFWLDMDYFDYCDGLRMTSRKFHDLFGPPPRDPEMPIEQLHMDLAASIQKVTEEVVLKTARHLHRTYQVPNLVLAGGVALNCVANGRLLREGPFRNVWIQPAAGDAGGALGAALFAWHQLLDGPRHCGPQDFQKGSFLGPEYSDEEIKSFLSAQGIPHRSFEREEELLSTVASMLSSEKIVGWMQGRMEFGPRALGARSILGDPRSSKTQSVMNLKIKYRESFRPFAPAVLEEKKGEWFDVEEHHNNPYMLMVAPVSEQKRNALTPEEFDVMTGDSDLIKRINITRSSVPAITHVDFSARVQTIGSESNPRFRKLIEAFYDETECPILVNTSFNVRGEPIVCSPADALRCFAATEMDALVLGKCIVDASAKGKLLNAAQRENHIASFELD